MAVATVATAESLAQSLIKAAEQGDLSAVNQLVEKVEDLNAVDPGTGFTALHAAVAANQAAAGAMIAECGADLDIKDKEGNTALHISAIKNVRMMTSMLLWAGCERNLVNLKGNTALHGPLFEKLAVYTVHAEACLVGSHDVAWLLCENQAEQSLTLKNNEGKLPLDLAQGSGNQELIDMLKEQIAELEQHNSAAAANPEANGA